MGRKEGDQGVLAPTSVVVAPRIGQALPLPAREHPKNTGVQGNTLHGGGSAAVDKRSRAFGGVGRGGVGLAAPLKSGTAPSTMGFTLEAFGVSTLWGLPCMQAPSHNWGEGGQPLLTQNQGNHSSPPQPLA